MRIFVRTYDEDGEEERRLAIVNWFRWRRHRRRERLVRKWSLDKLFQKQNVSGKWEVEFMSLVPEDDRWHQVTATVYAWVKKDKVRKDSEAQQYMDGVKIASVSMRKSKNITLGASAKRTTPQKDQS